jgi:glycosyltransferase involved in cell wall biosynthesis
MTSLAKSCKVEVDKPLKIGFLGGNNERKGLLFAVKALEPLISSGDVKLYVAGCLEEEVKMYKVEPLGIVKDLQGFFEKIDVLLVPSRYDSFPNVVLEAVAHKTPFLITDNEISREICLGEERFLFERAHHSLRCKVGSICRVGFSGRYLDCMHEMEKKYSFDWLKEIKLCVHGGIHK